MIPTECKMPDLNDCWAERLQVRSILHVFVGDPGLNRKQVSYRRVFARLVDKAIYEYQMTRKAILDQLAERDRSPEQMAAHGRQLFILAYTDHLENCVNAVNRAWHAFGCLQEEGISGSVQSELDRSLNTFSDSLEGLRLVRNAFEHVEERIQEDKIVEGQPVMLSISPDGERAVIGNDEVQFADVARTLRKLHELGKLLFETGHVQAGTGGAPAAGVTVLEGKTTITTPRVGGKDA